MTAFLQAQMDYIFFVYGLSFVVLGVICFAFFNEKDEKRIKLPTHYFGLFALLHGFNEWLDMIAITVFENRTFVLVRLAIMALSFLFLFEFARRSAVSGISQRGPQKRGEELRPLIFGYWIYLPLLLLAASGAWFGIAGANATVRYFIGLISALFSGWIFYQASRHESDENRSYLLIMGVALGMYGMLAGLVVPASQMPPARWINHDSFMKFTGAPVQLFRALCASIISIVFVYYHLNIKRKDIRRFIKGSRRALVVSLFIICIGFIVIAGWFVTNYIGAQGERQTEKENMLNSEIFLEHLNNEMQEVDQLVTVIARSSYLASAIITKQMETLNEITDRFQSTMKVDVCYLLDAEGMTVASSNRNALDSFVGKSYDFRPYFRQAITGSQGRYFALGKTSLERGYYSSFPVRNKKGIVIGVAVIKKNMLAIETSFQQHEYSFVTSPEGIIFISSSPDYLFKSLWPVDEKTKAGLRISRQFGDLTFETLLGKEPPDRSYVAFRGKQFFISRRPMGIPGWSLVLFGDPMNRSLYRMAGIVTMFTFTVFVIAAFYVLMKTEIMRETAERLARLNQEYRFLVDSSSDFIFRNDLHAGITYVSPSVETIMGRSQQEVLAHYPEYFTDNPINRKVIEYLGSVPVPGSEMRIYEAELHHKDGGIITLEIRERPLEENGKVTGTIGNARDITERKKAEKATQESSQFSRQVIDSVKEGIIVNGLDLKYQVWNPFMKQLTGLSADEVLGRHPLEIFPFLREAGVMTGIEKALAGKISEADVFQFNVPQTGRTGWASHISGPLRNSSGEIIGVIGTVRDITEYMRTQEALRGSQQILEGILNAIPVRVFWKDKNLIYQGGNTGFARDAGFADPKDIVGKDDYQMGWRDQAELYRSDDRQVIMGGNSKYLIEEPSTTPEGTIITLLTSKIPLLGAHGEIIGVLGTYMDITEFKRAQEALSSSEKKFKDLLETINLVAIILDCNGDITFCNDYFLRLTGWTRDKVLNKNWFDLFLPDHIMETIRSMFMSGIAEGVIPAHYENLILTRDGGKKYIEWDNSMLRDTRGNVIGLASIGTDVTEQRKLEAQLRHSQKMEAVGTLAGGIAHDFNNILNVIIGYGAMVMDSLEAGSPSKEQMGEVLFAADRAANLTKRLLVFSRKQVVEVKPIDINELIFGVKKMLVRIINESIDFKLDLADRPLIVLADAGQLEQVLVNLVVNAKDALKEGGQLTIGTGFEDIDDEYVAAYGYGTPGRYALITVADTGHGMDAETQKKIFEPFFTTKGIGEGTGLGLAISYGIIKQHSGYIKVYSEPGQGTVFKIYLPLSEEAILPDGKAEIAVQIAGGNETVLVVEDDASLRKLTRIMLESFGYRVITAEDGEDAIVKFRENREQISLVLLDMVMPKKNGKEVSEEIRKVSPGIKILFASGYTMDIIKTRELAGAGADFIHKPFQLKNLLIKVREVLDR